MTYTPDFGSVQPIDVLNLKSLEKRAEAVIGRGEFGYISEGSDDGYTKARNTTAFNDVQMLPRVLQNVENPDQSTKFLGSSLASPLMTARRLRARPWRILAANWVWRAAPRKPAS